MWFCLDLPFRVLALINGVVAFAAFHRFSARIGFSIDLLILAEAALMFLCIAVPLKPSRKWFNVLLVMTLFAGTYWIVRHLAVVDQGQKLLAHFGWFDFADIAVVFWFLLRSSGKLGPQHN